jgi:hypothetical protein
MNPHQHILDSFKQHVASYGKPQAPLPTAQPNAASMQPQNLAGALGQLQGLPAGHTQAFMLTPDAKRILAGIPQSVQKGAQVPSSFQLPQGQQLFNSFAQGDHSAQQGSPPVDAQQAPNPYLTMLQQRLGIGQQKGQMNSSSPQPGQNPAVMSGNFDAKNIVVPSYRPIKNSFALSPIKQGEGDLIT